MVTLKIRVDSYVGDHVTLTIFGASQDQDALVSRGKLTMPLIEYRVLVGVLHLGAHSLDPAVTKVMIDEDVIMHELQSRRETNERLERMMSGIPHKPQARESQDTNHEALHEHGCLCFRAVEWRW